MTEAQYRSEVSTAARVHAPEINAANFGADLENILTHPYRFRALPDVEYGNLAYLYARLAGHFAALQLHACDEDCRLCFECYQASGASNCRTTCKHGAQDAEDLTEADE